MLVNDNTVECNVSQEKKKLSRNYPRWRYRHKRNFLGLRWRHEKPVCSFLKQAENRVSDWSFRRNAIAS